MFVCDLDEGTEFAEDIQLGEAADTPENCAAIQPQWARLEKGAGRKLMGLNKGKSRALHLGRSNPRHQHRLGTGLLESRSGEKHLEDLVDKLSVSQHCPYSQEGQWDPSVHSEEHWQQVEGGYPAPLPCSSKAHL